MAQLGDHFKPFKTKLHWFKVFFVKGILHRSGNPGVQFDKLSENMVDDLKGTLTGLMSFKRFNLLTFYYSSLYLCAFLVFMLVIVRNKSTEVLSTCYRQTLEEKSAHPLF